MVDAPDCKSVYPGSTPGSASIIMKKRDRSIWLDMGEACKLMGVTRVTLKEMMDEDQIFSRRLGRRRYLRTKDCKELLMTDAEIKQQNQSAWSKQKDLGS